MTPLTRYIVVQIPGWFAIGLLLIWCVTLQWLSLQLASIIMAIWIGKDAALYPLCRIAFQTGPATGAKALIGKEAEVVTTLSPDGQVKIDGERWQATSADGETINAGQRIRIIDCDELKLIVQSND